jgi:hypothetical protein
MKIAKEELEHLASEYIREMTSIRGRRVKKFILREFVQCTDASISKKKDEIASFVGVLENKDILEIKTDGRGSSFAMYVKKEANTEVRHFSLLKDSLPLVEENNNRI